MSIASPNPISSQAIRGPAAADSGASASQARAFNDVAASLRQNGVAAPTGSTGGAKATTLDAVLGRIGASQSSEVGQGAAKTYSGLLDYLGKNPPMTI